MAITPKSIITFDYNPVGKHGYTSIVYNGETLFNIPSDAVKQHRIALAERAIEICRIDRQWFIHIPDTLVGNKTGVMKWASETIPGHGLKPQ